MRGIRVWARLVGLRRAVVEDVRMGIEGEVIVSVRPALAGARSLWRLSAPLAGV